MATRSHQSCLIIGALVLVILCLCAGAMLITGVGFFLLNQPVSTATPPMIFASTNTPWATRGTITVTPTWGLTPSARPTKPVVSIPQDQATCLAQGGRWGRIGLSPREQCNLPAPDAGRVCNDSSECTGLCLADLSPEEKERVTRQKVPVQTSGKCSNWVIVVGCVAEVESGQVRNIICRD